jgi:hypothetical protein
MGASIRPSGVSQPCGSRSAPIPGAALGSTPLDESPLVGEAPLPGAHLVAIGRHPKDDMTDKIDFKSFPAIGTELSHFFSSSSTGWGAARFIFGGRRRTRFVRFAGSTSIASSPLSSIHLKAISIPNWPSSWIHPEDVSIVVRSDLLVLGRRLARVFGLFQAWMSNRVAEEGVKSPQKPVKRVGGVERMMLNAGSVESCVVKQPLAKSFFYVVTLPFGYSLRLAHRYPPVPPPSWRENIQPPTLHRPRNGVQARSVSRIGSNHCPSRLQIPRPVSRCSLSIRRPLRRPRRSPHYPTSIPPWHPLPTSQTRPAT